MSSYAQLSEREVLTENDISNLARQLHARFRMDREKKDILPHVITLIEDFKKKAIPGHPLASVHLLSCLKDMEEFTLSNEFWEWLTTQDENFCDARTYGAAIECFSYQGVSLSELEAMWSEALERFSGTTVTSVAKNTGRGVPVMLLQGIITARLFHGDWRAAYEAFDICTRLYPSLTPARIYELFIYERPVREAYIVFLMACRAGTPPKPGVLTPLLKETWMETHDVRAMIRLVYAFVGAGGTPNAIHLNSLIGGILGSFPPELKPTDAEYEPLYHGMLGLVRALITVFNRMGVPLSTGSFNTIISLGGKLRRQELIHSGLKELIDAGLSPTMVTYRTLLNAVGDMADVMLLEESWSMLKTGREQLRVPWDFNDWKALIRACVATGRVDFFEGQLAVHSHELSEIFVRNIIAVLQRAIITSTATPTPTPETAPSTTPLDKQALIAEVKTLTEIFSSRRIADFTRASGSSSSDGSSLSNDDLFSLLPSDTTPSGVTLTAAQEAELHEIYVSIAPPPSVLDTETAGTKTSTGYDIDKLRFENWKAVNRLLFEAEWWEREQERRKVEATRAASGDSIVQEKKGKKEENVGYEFVFWNEERAKKRIFMDMQTVVEGMRKGEPDWRSREMEVRGRLGVGIRA
ncbi:hypothetical protein BZA05DRAFT_394025 [Tricharina praecox]|uniref:uncharacterized protein n=1 Tax=Tricharina praecox TaxID=43433 RepID=UPI00221FDF5F|nr:uncharacterized protein BZA05DRAFT_394025 [Tricharina praecox]KAI5854371.1 hypothetical protein BZA05DRAFT_394025 [Tricharina praecox]